MSAAILALAVAVEREARYDARCDIEREAWKEAQRDAYLDRLEERES